MESEFANIYAEGQSMLRLSRYPTFLANDKAMFEVLFVSSCNSHEGMA